MKKRTTSMGLEKRQELVNNDRESLKVHLQGAMAAIGRLADETLAILRWQARGSLA